MLSTILWGLGIYFAVSLVAALVVGRILHAVSAAYPVVETEPAGAYEPVFQHVGAEVLTLA